MGCRLDDVDSANHEHDSVCVDRLCLCLSYADLFVDRGNVVSSTDCPKRPPHPQAPDGHPDERPTYEVQAVHTSSAGVGRLELVVHIAVVRSSEVHGDFCP